MLGGYETVAAAWLRSQKSHPHSSGQVVMMECNSFCGWLVNNQWSCYPTETFTHGKKNQIVWSDLPSDLSSLRSIFGSRIPNNVQIRDQGRVSKQCGYFKEKLKSISYAIVLRMNLEKTASKNCPQAQPFCFLNFCFYKHAHSCYGSKNAEYWILNVSIKVPIWRFNPNSVSSYLNQ